MRKHRVQNELTSYGNRVIVNLFLIMTLAFIFVLYSDVGFHMIMIMALVFILAIDFNVKFKEIEHNCNMKFIVIKVQLHKEDRGCVIHQ